MRTEIAKALLAAGADVSRCKNLLRSVEGNTPLREQLIEHGAAPSTELTPVTWSDDKSRAEVRMDIRRSHGALMVPSTEDLTAILKTQSLVECLFEVVRGYDSNDYDEDEGRESR